MAGGLVTLIFDVFKGMQHASISAHKNYWFALVSAISKLGMAATTGTKGTPHADLVIRSRDGQEHSASSDGTGPVDAAYGAVNQIIQLENVLLEYSVNSVTEGIDAQAVVSVQIKVGDRIFSGSNGETDIVVASTKAYLEALNRALVVAEGL